MRRGRDGGLVSRTRRTAAGLAVALWAAASFAGSCSNPMRVTVESVVEEGSRPTATVDFQDGAGIAPDTRITLTFDESMDPASLVLGGSLADESDGGAWSEGSATNDTLTISPADSWSVGSGKTLSVAAADLDTYEILPLQVEYGVLDGVVYVHAEDGSDASPGTPDHPKASIQAAVTTAERVFDEAEVRVAEGTYTVAQAIRVQSKTMLKGGYSQSDWAVRVPATYLTLIEDNRVAGYNETVSFGAGASVGAGIDGFRISAANGDASTAVFVTGGAAPEILNCDIVLGAATGNSYGISVDESTATVEESRFHMGTYGGTGVALSAISSQIRFHRNRIEGGLRDTLYGLSLSGSDSIVTANVMVGGECVDESTAVLVDGGSVVLRNNVLSAGTTASSNGVISLTCIFLRDTDGTVQNNILDGGSGPGDSVHTTAVMLYSGSPIAFQNNIVFTSGGGLRTGVWQASADTVPSTFENNTMFDNEDGNYYDAPNNDGYGSNPATLESYLTSEGATATGNLFADPQLSASADYAFTDSSPSSVTQGGKDLSSEFTTDITGAPRTADNGWSMGAYEKD